MTAEIAILNKTAVALAADSAVTLSVGTDQHKVFDSEDKLFELSRRNAIGIMINSNMHFMEVPLPVMIKRYRGTAPPFVRVTEAADSFLRHLQEFGKDSPGDVAERNVRNAVRPVLAFLKERIDEKFQDRLLGKEGDITDFTKPDGFSSVRNRVYHDQIAALHRLISAAPATELIGERHSTFDLDAHLLAEIDAMPFEGSVEAKEAALALVRSVLERRVPFSPSTGLIFAGYGSDDLFPTLISYELFGVVEGQLRIHRTNHVDVDRNGVRARVIPFAQKEMVERFLYGLDERIERRITDFCKATIPTIRKKTLDRLEMEPDDMASIEADMEESEAAVLTDLRDNAFEALREESRDEIEGMVEFMPKSEMGRMAEALVNLTSIKRRVSRGMETVGGPIDVAVISQADGFVWVKRKHYFPGELNNRYFDRMREPTTPTKEP